jgi:hypothetical protein
MRLRLSTVDKSIGQGLWIPDLQLSMERPWLTAELDQADIVQQCRPEERSEDRPLLG